MDFENPIKQNAKLVRLLIAKTLHKTQNSHIGSAFSVVEILLSVIYFCESNLIKNRILLSKGHAAIALYATLEVLNLENFDLENNYSENASEVYGHVNHKASKYIPLSTGSLGHGFPFGVGIALAKKLNDIPGKTFVLMSDGECNEGTTWESALLGNHFNLENLVVIVDRNRLQSLAGTEETLKLEPLIDKWQKFGWKCLEVNGHNPTEILSALSQDGPICIVANTIKGKGISFMENSVPWHYKSPNSEEMEIIYREIRNS